MRRAGPGLILAAFVALAAPAAAAGGPAAGEGLFLDRCVMCHIAEGGGQGPPLKGVIGRKAGSVDGFAYSAALRADGRVWTGPELDRFITNPSTAIPGTAMPIQVPDAKEREDLISYFATFR